MNASDVDATFEDNSYNFIYEKLVESKDDINGMIAYALYKREKIEFIRSFLSKCGRAPTEEERKSFFVSSNTDARLNAYRTQAGVIAREFLEISLEEKVKEIEGKWQEGYLQGQIGSDLKELKRFGPGVLQGVVSSWIFSFSIALVLLAAVVIRVGPSDAFNEVLRVIKGEPARTEMHPQTFKEPRK
ncbi:MAG: hypothetical protein ACK587_12480 [Cyanobacteriota bacterium]